MSRIVLPQAPTRLGASAAPAAPVDPGLGDAAARFGERLAQAGRALEADRLERNALSVQLDIERRLGERRLELQQETNPDRLEDGWRESAPKIREETLAASDPQNRERLELIFDRLEGRHALAIGSLAVDRRGAQMRGSIAELRNAAQFDPAIESREGRATREAEHAARLASAVSLGHVTPEQASNELASLRAELAGPVLRRRLSEDPAALIAEIDAGEFDDVPTERREMFRASATAEVERRDAAEARRAEQESREAQAVVGRRLSVVRAAAATGVPVEGQEELLLSDEAKAHPDFAATRAAVTVMRKLPEFAAMPPARQAAEIARLRANPIGEKFELAEIEALEAAHADAVEGLLRDPIAFARQVGIASPPDLPDDMSNPAAWTEVFAARAILGRVLADPGEKGDGAYLAAPVYFSRADRDRLKAMVDETADPAARARLAGAFANGFGADAPRALEEIGAGPVFAHFGGLVARTGTERLAAEAFAGQRAIELGNVKPPPQDVQLAAVEAALGDVELPDEDAFRATLRASAEAIYGARARGLDPADDPATAEKAFGEAVQAALGGEGQFGGARDINGRTTILPPEVLSTSVERALEVIAPEAWQAATPTGGAPQFADGTPLTTDSEGRLQLIAVTPDLYAVEYFVRGNAPMALQDSETGGALLIDLRRFISASRRWRDEHERKRGDRRNDRGGAEADP